MRARPGRTVAGQHAAPSKGPARSHVGLSAPLLLSGGPTFGQYVITYGPTCNGGPAGTLLLLLEAAASIPVPPALATPSALAAAVRESAGGALPLPSLPCYLR